MTETAPLADVGAAGSGARDGRGQTRVAVAERVGVPFLVGVAADADVDPEVRAAALLALPKLSNGAGVRRVLRLALADRRTNDEVRESAALGMGLLRRSDPELRMPPGDLADVRRDLLEVVDDVREADRTRAFAAFALGLLGDQPFALEAEQGGSVLALALWVRVGRMTTCAELPVALLTALGMQSTAEVPEEVSDGLRGLAVGRSTLGRRWGDVERSHALSAACRLWPKTSWRNVLLVLTRPSEGVEMTRAATLSAGALAPQWSAEGRAKVALELVRTLDRASDPWTRGLVRVSLGQVVSADGAADSARLAATDIPRGLLAAARQAPHDERGYALLGLALAARSRAGEGDAPAWVGEAHGLALEGVTRSSEDDSVRSAHAVALGLLGRSSAVRALETCLADQDLGALTRQTSAVALGQIGMRSPAVVRALVLTLFDRRNDDVRGDAALALSWLGTREALPFLLREVRDPRVPERTLAEVAVALGRLGAVGAVDTLAELAADDSRRATTRALAVAALGLVLDAEPRPSLLRFVAGANYPARTPALHELLTIL